VKKKVITIYNSPDYLYVNIPVYFSIHSKRSCPTTSSEKFGEAIKTAFDDMKGLYADVLESN
jgi:hypothetical protein